MTVMVAICAIYVVLGTAMEELSMILLTVPVFFPLVVALGFDPVWFGIIIVVVVQIGLISPPVGMNMQANPLAATSLQDFIDRVAPLPLPMSRARAGVQRRRRRPGLSGREALG